MPDTLTEKRYLTFSLGQQQYSLDSIYLEEMLPLPEITTLPTTASDIIGILNLRGEIVPVLDLNLSLGHPKLAYRTTDSIIILKQSQLRVGLVVSQIGDLELHQTIEVDESDTRLKAQRNQAVRKQMIAGQVISIERNQLHAVALNADSSSTEPCWILNPPEQWLRYIEVQQLVSLAQLLKENPAALPEEMGVSPSADFCPEATAEEQTIFQQRAASLKESTVKNQAVSSASTLAIVTIHDNYVGIDLSVIKEFTDLNKAVTPIPCCPPHIVGNTNLRGEILTLVDLSGVLRSPEQIENQANHTEENSPLLAGAKVMVVEIDQYVVGVLVNGVLEAMFPLNSADEQKPISPSNTIDSQYVKGEIDYRETTVSILDLPKVLKKGNLIVDEVI